jgi:hypothetical protein
VTEPAAAPVETPAAPAGVQEALALLGGLDGRAAGEQVAVFDEVHRLLQDTLATLDEV